LAKETSKSANLLKCKIYAYLLINKEISCKQVKKWFANKRIRSQFCYKNENKLKKQITDKNSSQLVASKMSIKHRNPNPHSSPSIIMQNEQLSNGASNSNLVHHQMATRNSLVMMNLLSPLAHQCNPLLFQTTSPLGNNQNMMLNYTEQNMLKSQQQFQKRKYIHRNKNYSIETEKDLLISGKFQNVDLIHDLIEDGYYIDEHSPTVIEDINFNNRERNNKEKFFVSSINASTSLTTSSNQIKSYAFCDQHKLAFKKRKFENLTSIESCESSNSDSFIFNNYVSTGNDYLKTQSSSNSLSSYCSCQFRPQSSIDSSN
jgi:hypothetical protein